MKSKKVTCELCGKEFDHFLQGKTALGVDDVPSICDSRVCRTNAEYQRRYLDPLSGKSPSPEEIRKI